MTRRHPYRRRERPLVVASRVPPGRPRPVPPARSCTVMAAEPNGAYDLADTGSPGTPSPAQPAEVLDRLRQVAHEVARLDLDACTDAALRTCLEELRRPLAMLEATRARLLADLEQRAARRVPPGGNARGARDEERRRAATQQHLSRSRMKREAEAGHAAREHHATGRAFAQGDIGTDHVRLIADLLTQVPAEQRDEVEARLLGLACDHEPVTFGRNARALLHELAADRNAAAERLQESRRELRIADTPEGSVVLSGRLFGTSAELVRVALDAFRRPDTPDEPRTVEQRNADALLQLCEVALRAEQAPTQHGARPHVVVLVRDEDLGGGAGPARFGFSGQPVNLALARRLFSDCVVSRLVLAADGTPIEASAGRRTVPAGLHRALVARDGGCTWAGCDAPASWCDVAHGNVPFRQDEPLRLGDAALLCRRHHRRFDHGPYRMVISGGRVRYERLDAAARPTDGARADPDPPPDLGAGTTDPDPPPDTGRSSTDPDPPRLFAAEPDGSCRDGPD